MAKKIDIRNDEIQVHEVGTLNSKVISLLGLHSNEMKIVIGKDKLKYIEKHKHKFKNNDEYIRHIESLPDIIENPDFVGLHPSGDSIEYIKQIDEILLIAVRIRNQGKLWIKSVFPITKDKLETYKRAGSLREYK